MKPLITDILGLLQPSKAEELANYLAVTTVEKFDDSISLLLKDIDSSIRGDKNDLIISVLELITLYLEFQNKERKLSRKIFPLNSLRMAFSKGLGFWKKIGADIEDKSKYLRLLKFCVEISNILQPSDHHMLVNAMFELNVSPSQVLLALMTLINKNQGGSAASNILKFWFDNVNGHLQSVGYDLDSLIELQCSAIDMLKKSTSTTMEKSHLIFIIKFCIEYSPPQQLESCDIQLSEKKRMMMWNEFWDIIGKHPPIIAKKLGISLLNYCYQHSPSTLQNISKHILESQNKEYFTSNTNDEIETKTSLLQLFPLVIICFGENDATVRVSAIQSLTELVTQLHSQSPPSSLWQLLLYAIADCIYPLMEITTTMSYSRDHKIHKGAQYTALNILYSILTTNPFHREFPMECTYSQTMEIIRQEIKLLTPAASSEEMITSNDSKSIINSKKIQNKTKCNNLSSSGNTNNEIGLITFLEESTIQENCLPAIYNIFKQSSRQMVAVRTTTLIVQILLCQSITIDANELLKCLDSATEEVQKLIINMLQQRCCHKVILRWMNLLVYHNDHSDAIFNHRYVYMEMAITAMEALSNSRSCNHNKSQLMQQPTVILLKKLINIHREKNPLVDNNKNDIVDDNNNNNNNNKSKCRQIFSSYVLEINLIIENQKDNNCKINKHPDKRMISGDNSNYVEIEIQKEENIEVSLMGYNDIRDNNQKSTIQDKDQTKLQPLLLCCTLLVDTDCVSLLLPCCTDFLNSIDITVNKIDHSEAVAQEVLLWIYLLAELADAKLLSDSQIVKLKHYVFPDLLNNEIVLPAAVVLALRLSDSMLLLFTSIGYLQDEAFFSDSSSFNIKSIRQYINLITTVIEENRKKISRDIRQAVFSKSSSKNNSHISANSVLISTTSTASIIPTAPALNKKAKKDAVSWIDIDNEVDEEEQTSAASSGAASTNYMNTAQSEEYCQSQINSAVDQSVTSPTSFFSCFYLFMKNLAYASHGSIPLVVRIAALRGLGAFMACSVKLFSENINDLENMVFHTTTNTTSAIVTGNDDEEIGGNKKSTVILSIEALTVWLETFHPSLSRTDLLIHKVLQLLYSLSSTDDDESSNKKNSNSDDLQFMSAILKVTYGLLIEGKIKNPTDYVLLYPIVMSQIVHLADPPSKNTIAEAEAEADKSNYLELYSECECLFQTIVISQPKLVGPIIFRICQTPRSEIRNNSNIPISCASTHNRNSLQSLTNSNIKSDIKIEKDIENKSKLPSSNNTIDNYFDSSSIEENDNHPLHSKSTSSSSSSSNNQKRMTTPITNEKKQPLKEDSRTNKKISEKFDHGAVHQKSGTSECRENSSDSEVEIIIKSRSSKRRRHAIISEDEEQEEEEREEEKEEEAFNIKSASEVTVENQAIPPSKEDTATKRIAALQTMLRIIQEIELHSTTTLVDVEKYSVSEVLRSGSHMIAVLLTLLPAITEESITTIRNAFEIGATQTLSPSVTEMLQSISSKSTGISSKPSRNHSKLEDITSKKKTSVNPIEFSKKEAASSTVRHKGSAILTIRKSNKMAVKITKNDGKKTVCKHKRIKKKAKDRSSGSSSDEDSDSDSTEREFM